MPAPDATAPLVAWLLAPASLAALGLVGHLATRAFPSPCRPATAFAAGLLLLFFAVLACDTLAVPITLPTLALPLAAAALAGLLLSRRFRRPPQVSGFKFQLSPLALLLVPVVLAFASVVARGVLDPLAGWDNLWRWDHLARLVLATGSLSAYPPAAPDHFLAYPWCDGIPPLAAVSNLWIYLASGSAAPALVSARLAAELALVALLLWQLSRDLFGPLAARLSLLALAASSLFLASVSIAQESGLVAVALLLLARCALAYHRAPRLSNALWLAAAAALAALLRDYNLLFVPVALAILALLRAPRRHLAAAALLLLVFVVPWYLRNWLRTGHPLYAHDLAGLFPTNPYHDYLLAEIRRFWSPANSPGFAASLAAPLAAGAALLALSALAALRFLRRPPSALRLPAALALPALATIALWLASIPATAGGVVYSLRVLGPALPFLALAAGACATLPRPAVLTLATVLALGATDAARRHWLFFLDPLAAPAPYTWEKWTPTAAVHARFSREKLWPALAASLAPGERIVADNPSFTVLAARQGVAVTPLWSPDLLAATTPAPSASPITAEQTRAALLAAGVRFLVLGEDTTFGRELHSRHPRLGPLYATPPAARFEGLRLYDLRLPLGPPSAPARPPAPDG